MAAEKTTETKTLPDELEPVAVEPVAPVPTAQDAAIAELRALVESLQAQITAGQLTQLAHVTPDQGGVMTLPVIGFDKGDDDEPRVIVKYGSGANAETLDVQKRHAGILEQLGWKIAGKSA